MEISKEKFIETFKKECEKAVTAINPDLFRSSGSNEEPAIEIISNEKVSFLVTKTSNNDENNTCSYAGKILFAGFVDYQSIDLTEDEFESLYEQYYQNELKVRMAAKNKIILEGESVLMQVLQ